MRPRYSGGGGEVTGRIKTPKAGDWAYTKYCARTRTSVIMREIVVVIVLRV